MPPGKNGVKLLAPPSCFGRLLYPWLAIDSVGWLYGYLAQWYTVALNLTNTTSFAPILSLSHQVLGSLLQVGSLKAPKPVRMRHVHSPVLYV